MKTEAFLERHPVFRLGRAARAFGHRNRRAMIERLRYHVSTGRLKRVAKFRPDAFLVAAAVRADAVFSHHSALELLGASHSEWNAVTVLTRSRRKPLRVDGQSIEFLGAPAVLVRAR